MGFKYPSYRKDQNNYGDGKTVSLREDVIAKTIIDFEGNTNETICLEPNISKKIGFIIFAKRPFINNNKDIFFSELSNSLNCASIKYDNLLLIKDLNIDTLNKKKDNGNCFLIYVNLSL